MSMLDVLFIGVSDIEQVLLENFIDNPLQVRVANNLSQVESQLQAKKPALTICDAEIPGLDIRNLCDASLFEKCVILSSRDKHIERRKSLLQVEERYLTRPYSQEQLNQAISVALH